MSETAIVTGASGGIGRSCAARLAEEYDVLVHYNSDREGAEAAAERVREAGSDARLHQCDIADSEAVESMVEAASDLGPVGCLVNNAAVFLERSIEDVSREEVDLQVDVNLKGTIYCTQAVLGHMLDGGGRIVTISSVAGTHGSPTDPVYAATKGGVVSLTKSIAKQYASEGVFANAVAPGPTATEMFREGRRPAVREESPMGRLIRPDEIADAVRYFATATGVTGQVLVVDGGNRR
jgi:3-oxoacyl-[acyl-carrier protein] reductase